jgi:thioredoxin 1
MAQPITDNDFDAEVLKAAVPVVVDFWAPWCGPCRAMIPIFDELSAQYGEKVKFAKINVDEQNEHAGQLGVMSIPTFIIFKDGVAVKTFVGTRSKTDFENEINALL